MINDFYIVCGQESLEVNRTFVLKIVVETKALINNPGDIKLQKKFLWYKILTMCC